MNMTSEETWSARPACRRSSLAPSGCELGGAGAKPHPSPRTRACAGLKPHGTSETAVGTEPWVQIPGLPAPPLGNPGLNA